MTKEKIEKRLARWRQHIVYAEENMEDALKFPVFCGTDKILADAQERLDGAKKMVAKYEKMLENCE